MADEQVGNNSYLTMTPGSAVAGQLQDILTRKRLEARQAMLDELNRKNIESEMRYREENAKGLAEQRAGLAQTRRDQAEKMFLDKLGDNPKNLDPATAAQLQTIDPSRLETVPGGATLPSVKSPTMGFRVGAPVTEQPSMASTVDPSQPDPSIPTTNRYTGSPAYTKQHETSAKMEALFKDPSFTNGTDEQKLLAISQIFPGTDPAAIFERLLTSKTQQAPGHAFIWDAASNRRIDTGPLGPNDKFSVEPRPAATPVEHPRWEGNTPEGVAIFNMNKIDKDGVPILMTSEGKRYTGKIAKVPAAGAGGKDVISSQDRKTYAQLRGKATGEPGAWGGILPDQAAKQSAIVAFNQFEDSLLGRFDPDLVKVLKKIVSSEKDPNVTNEDIVKHSMDNGWILPDEEQKLYALLQTVRSR